jgi:hypothetical protein
LKYTVDGENSGNIYFIIIIIIGTINEDGHTKSALNTDTDVKLTSKLDVMKAEHTVATSTDTSSMCSTSSDGSDEAVSKSTIHNHILHYSFSLKLRAPLILARLKIFQYFMLLREP